MGMGLGKDVGKGEGAMSFKLFKEKYNWKLRSIKIFSCRVYEMWNELCAHYEPLDG